MKRLSWVLIAAAVVALVALPSLAFANNGAHGGYLKDTDLCAQCHRAHTAPSDVTWTGAADGLEHNALLLSNATSMENFCFACHDAGAQGADTNVVDGMYEGSTYGTPNSPMISGPFGAPVTGGNKDEAWATVSGETTMVTSSHLTNGAAWGAYGGGVFQSKVVDAATGNLNSDQLGTGDKIVMDCSTCHDPHGTSNYRLLKSVVYGVPVGGYTAGGKPDAYVVSNEEGFPVGNATDGYGFALHTSYTSTYKPDYTVAKYATSPDGTTGKGMSGWCVGCHTVYAATTSKYDAGDGAGYVTRHRHPVNIAMVEGLNRTGVALTSALPLDAVPVLDANSAATGHPDTTSSANWVECLTCHNAHGTTVTMTGYAAPSSTFSDPTTSTVIRYPAPDSALLKMNNRGVCEECHKK